MKNILILEDDIYLAQKVSTKLQDEGYYAIHYTSINEVDVNKNFDTVLLSTSVPVGNTNQIINTYKDCVIILLVAYVSDATVVKPLKAGASDYVLKPFSIDELIRKVKHYETFKKLLIKTKSLENYVNYFFSSVNTQKNQLPDSFPILIESNNQKIADKIVFDLAQERKKEIMFISLEKGFQKNFKELDDKIIYIYDFYKLKSNTKDMLLKNIDNNQVVLYSPEIEKDFPYNKIVIEDNDLEQYNTILTINDYVKMIITKFQTQYPDTELSKKLGISRKSLWEKRKKFGLEKGK